MRREQDDEDILIDTQATASVFKNASLLKDIRKSKQAVRITGIDKGSIKTHLKGHSPVFGDVWYNPKVLANVWSFAEAAKRFVIDYNHKRNEIVVKLSKDTTLQEGLPRK